MLKKLTLICCIVGFCASPSTQAESWADLDSTPGKSFFQFDLDSVIPAGNGQYRVKWRSGKSLETPYFLKQGVVDCFRESVELSTSSYIETDPILIRYGGSAFVTDFAAGTHTFGNRVSRISESDRTERNRFPSGSDPLAKLIRSVCHEDYFPVAEREAIAASFQRKLGCGTPRWEDSPLCAKDPDTMETLYAVLMRLGQVKEACAVEQGQVDAVLHNWISKVIECQGTPHGCGKLLLQLDLRGLGDDLAKAASKQSCDYFQRSVTSAAEDTESRAAINRFRGCVKQKIPALDDRLSSAETIARAVVGACRNELPVNLKFNPAAMENAIPGLTAQVLEFRQFLLKQPPAQNRPKKPKDIQS